MRALLATVGLSFVIGVTFSSVPAAAPITPDATPAPPSGWRGPVALWLAPESSMLFAACDKSGSIMVIDVATGGMMAEKKFGKSLVAMAATPDGRTLAVCDADANELLLLDRSGSDLQLRRRIPVPAKPMSVVIDAAGRNCFVTSLWARQLTKVELAAAVVSNKTLLDFSPRNLLLLADGNTLVVTDAFGGKLALVDAQTGSLVRQIDIPGHNIRGLALAEGGRTLLASHMILTESASLTRDNVFWGIAMTSNVRIIPVSALLDPQKNPIREAQTHFFSDPGNAAGDPAALASLGDGTTLVCLAGVGDVAIGRYYPSYGFRRVHVGQRPSALAISADEKLAYVANAHSDSISVIDIGQMAEVNQIRLGPEPPLSLSQEGERLFYDARLSLDGWFSCNSCHSDGHTNGQKADTFGDGSYGASKVVLSLLGTGNSEPWAWNGSKRQLDEQVRESLKLTMQPKSPANERTVAAITAYLMTLEPPPVTEFQKADESAIARGEKIFSSRGCTTCHPPPTYTNSHVYDVGMNDGEGGNKLFNPPSLRGVAHISSYFHDGRAKTLEDVFRQHKHRIRGDLPDNELNDLVAFLRSL